MIPEWPETLRKFTRDGWQRSPQDSRRKIQPDAGPPRYRRRYSLAPQMVGLTLIVNRNEKAIFETFYHETCAEGSLNFRMPDPASDGWPLLNSDGTRLLTGAGEPLLVAARRLCAWGDQVPVQAMDGDVDFAIQFSVVVLP